MKIIKPVNNPKRSRIIMLSSNSGVVMTNEAIFVVMLVGAIIFACATYVFVRGMRAAQKAMDE